MNVFDIETPKQFFHSICSRYRKYQQPVEKGGRTTEDLLYVIMGLNHLREWIAPQGKDREFLPTCTELSKKLFNDIYECKGFKALNDITNGVKHLRATETGTMATGGTTVDEWTDFDAIGDIDFGAPSGHLIDDQPAKTFIDPVIAMYQRWFDRAERPLSGEE